MGDDCIYTYTQFCFPKELQFNMTLLFGLLALQIVHKLVSVLNILRNHPNKCQILLGKPLPLSTQDFPFNAFLLV